MKLTTKEMHEKLTKLGKKLGFKVEKEVTSSLLSLRVEKGYRPRIDLLWSLPLNEPQRSAIVHVMGSDLNEVTHLPIVGIEVEGTDPTTKTIMSDTANLKALGAPISIIVTSEEHSPGMYRRSVRAIRTIRQNFGIQTILPLEASWIDSLLKKRWDASLAVPDAPQRKKPKGGESKEWVFTLRKHLWRLGREAGFVVSDPFNPQFLNSCFKAESERRSKQMCHLWDPTTGETREVKKSSDYLTSSELDMAWLLPLPLSVMQLMKEILKKDPCLCDYDIVFPSIWDHVPVVGFEFESVPSKHAGGCLLNLAAYSVIGIAYTDTETRRAILQNTLETYMQTLGLRNVITRAAE